MKIIFKNHKLGPLTLLGAVFIASGGLRLAVQDVALIADASTQNAAGAQHEQQGKPEQCQTDEDLQRVLDALLEREELVAISEKQIKQRLSAVAMMEGEAQDRLKEAELAEENLQKTMTLSQAIAEDDLARLTSVYERMKPKSAAALFQEMQPEFAAGFIARMKPDSAAAVLASLDARSAYAISVVLAGRNANAGKIEE
ncbi:MotE family protein [Pseudoprimorskyibacter insulae]|uniref:Magnesium transporter MgtE intracellular domain-containing protein n=1 Tax=Pseudoprimorskyibacter insulae TaxID=1695997 RepID=A0A2R8AYJ1_9RHOB|nr:hypothetical protein [Pseudoprimorskyibacter insulae]SPF81103.1 hypothetical protein PRI8871_02921 [Pseudoprimorskyibacter insulae]